MAEQVTIAGLAGVLEALEALPREIASRNGGPVRTALGRGARLIKDEAVRRAPVATGKLQKNIIAARDRNPQRAGPGIGERYIVGVRGGARQKLANTRRNRRAGTVGQDAVTQGNTFYWRFLEFGTAKMPAKPFLRPAFEAMKQAALDEVVSSLGKGIDRIAARLARQGRGR